MPDLIAEVISIGDELTSGQRLDTNSQWLSERLGELGVRVMYHTTVADDLDANVAVFRTAIDRADVVVATGGLGPTADDLTREALAAVAGVPLELDQASLDYIAGLFARFKRDMPESNRVQAMFPQGSRDHSQQERHRAGHLDGSAAHRRRRVPRVRLAGRAGRNVRDVRAHDRAGGDLTLRRRAVIRHRRIKCFGAGESHLEQMLPDLIRRGRQPSVGITVHAATITLRITAMGATAEECFLAHGAHRGHDPRVPGLAGVRRGGRRTARRRRATARANRPYPGDGGNRHRRRCWPSGSAAPPAGKHHYLGGQVLHSPSMLVQSLGKSLDLVEQHGPAIARSGRSAGRASSAHDRMPTTRWWSDRFPKQSTTSADTTCRFTSRWPAPTR